MKEDLVGVVEMGQRSSARYAGPKRDIIAADGLLYCT